MPDDLSLEARLRRLEDLEAIRQLQIDYGNALDRGNVDAYVALFTEDAELNLGPIARCTGHAEIREAATRMSGGGSIHLIGNPQITLDGDTAKAVVSWTVVAAGENGQPTVTSTGAHRDDLVRTADGWRLTRRRGFVNIPAVQRASSTSALPMPTEFCTQATRWYCAASIGSSMSCWSS
jgi:3-phenylpropionate/cinnamic acid dioxygenase small subunit